MNKYVGASFLSLILCFLFFFLNASKHVSTEKNVAYKPIMSLFPTFVGAFGNKIEKKTNTLIRRA